MVNIKNYIKKEVKRRCPCCHNDIIIKKGLSSDNVKRLFRKPVLEDFIILFILILAISSFLIYTYEIKAYKAFINTNCPIVLQNKQNIEIYLPGDTRGLENTIFDDDSDLSFKINNTTGK